MRQGARLEPYDPDAIQRRLLDTDLFDSVSRPTLALDPGDRAVVVVEVEERPPGAFDLLLGYLPASTPDGSGQLVGNGTLFLRNLFGSGRELGIRLVRNPGLVTSLDARVADPTVLGLPLRIEAQFEGQQQDSTFNRQRYRLEVGYRIAPGLDVFGAFSREATRPGLAGSRLRQDGRPLVARADATFGGFGIRYRRLDNPISPRRGFYIETLAEQGAKTRQVVAGDVARLGQQRLTAEARAFVPLFRRQVLALGGDALALRSDAYDESDLFYYGGATSLRGYDEQRFLGNVAGRIFAEYRYQLDRASFAFLFADLGYIGQPAFRGRVDDEQAEAVTFPQTKTVRPGYGLGLQQRSPLGLITVTYALNPEDGLTGRLHAGVSVGL